MRALHRQIPCRLEREKGAGVLVLLLAYNAASSSSASLHHYTMLTTRANELDYEYPTFMWTRDWSIMADGLFVCVTDCREE